MLLRHKKVWPLLAGLCLSSSLAAVQPADVPDRTFAPGRVLPARDQAKIDGWTRAWGGDWANRDPEKGPATETRECCYAVFEKDDHIVVLRTQPVTRGARGKVLTERIRDRIGFDLEEGDSTAECRLASSSPLLSIREEKSGMIWSVFIDETVWVTIKWVNPTSWCF